MNHLIEGNPASSVRVVIYEDLQCADCRGVNRWVQRRLLPAYADRVAFEHRDFPLPKHDWARPAAMAAKHFDSIGLGVQFRRQILEELMLVTPESLAQWISEFAASHEVDAAAAVQALERTDLAQAVEADYQSGVALNVRKTPTVFVNGKVFIERFPYEELVTAIEAALAAAAPAGEISR
jgi:protein-disulfide isomerase